MSSDLPYHPLRRSALKFLVVGDARNLFVLAGSVRTPVEPTFAGSTSDESVASGVPLLLQFSGTHIGFNKDAIRMLRVRSSRRLASSTPCRSS